MKVKVRTADGRKITLPVPLSAVGAVLRLTPPSLWRAAGENVPEPYKPLVSRKVILLYYRACKEVLHDYPGLELVRVKAEDGTFVSIRL